MPILPDTKDWTWVLERPCPECGLDTRAVLPRDVPALLEQQAARWLALLDDVPVEQLRQRPTDDRWSPLEYACHVRDVLALFNTRLTLMLKDDDPHFDHWDQDATAVAEHYGAQDPQQVANGLAKATAALAARYATVEGHDWQRTGSRSDGAHFTVESISLYLYHEMYHHLHDVGAL